MLHGFYKKVFGWRMQPTPGQPDYQMVEKEADGIAGGVGASQDGSTNVTVYVNCDDIDAQLGAIEAAGGKRAMPKLELPGGMGWIAGFHDPAGNWIGLWQPPRPAAPARKATTKKATARKATTKKATARKATTKNATARKATTKKKPPAKKTKAPSKTPKAKKKPAPTRKKAKKKTRRA
jgi:predicted enzyme related to lactoylglutathione lyase